MLVAALLGVVAIMAVIVAAVGQVALATARAGVAADAAALAAAPVTFAAFGGESVPSVAGARAARANGFRLISCSCPIDRSFARRTVVVEVEAEVEMIVGVRFVRGTSSAVFDPMPIFDH